MEQQQQQPKRQKQRPGITSHHQLINVIVKFTYYSIWGLRRRPFLYKTKKSKNEKLFRCSTNSNGKSSWLESNKTKTQRERGTGSSTAHVLSINIPKGLSPVVAGSFLRKKRCNSSEDRPGKEEKASQEHNKKDWHGMGHCYLLRSISACLMKYWHGRALASDGDGPK